MRGRRYRQLALFLAVLILPGIMILVQGRRIAAAEEELAVKGLEDVGRLMAAEIGQQFVAHLERIKTQEMANTPVGVASQGQYSDPAVVAVGWVAEDRLVWPWDESAPESPSVESAEFASLLRAAKVAEFRDGSPTRAASQYQQALNLAGNDRQKAAAGLGLARMLVRTGDAAAAAAICRDLLKTPSTVSDDSGLPQWSSAAAFCLELGFGGDILRRVTLDLDSPGIQTTPRMYRLGSLLRSLKDGPDPAVQVGARSALERLDRSLRDRDKAIQLQKDFNKLRVTATDWKVWRSDEAAGLWIVGQAPSPTDVAGRPIALAVRWDIIERAVKTEREMRGDDTGFSIGQACAESAGTALSGHLPGLCITFPNGIKAAASAIGPQRSFWGLSFALVTALTVLGGYLLWRDVRREAHMAELRTQFVSSVSHELKTPLTSIRMFAELLQMRQSMDPEQQLFLQTIVSESERLTRLLNNVLDFSRLERGQKTYRLELASLADIVQAAVRAIQSPLSQQGFILNLNVCDGLPPVAVDRDALQQAILNLLTNAMKYSGERREIGLQVSAKHGNAFIEVSDYGIGIAENEQPRIFEKFYRAAIPENRDISGTGLGLALVAHIAEGHGGSVGVKSSLGKGSTFSIRLPLNTGAAA